MSRAGHHSFLWIAPLYPWYVPYNAECYARRYQVPFFKSLVWHDLGWNSGLRVIGEHSTHLANEPVIYIWEVGGYTTVVSWDVASRICSIWPVAFESNSRRTFALYARSVSKWCIHIVELTRCLKKKCLLFDRIGLISIHSKQQLYNYLPPISKTIQKRRIRQAGHCWRSKNEHISNVLLWTPSHKCWTTN